jgi:hypothetical protein
VVSEGVYGVGGLGLGRKMHVHRTPRRACGARRGGAYCKLGIGDSGVALGQRSCSVCEHSPLKIASPPIKQDNANIGCITLVQNAYKHKISWKASPDW